MSMGLPSAMNSQPDEASSGTPYVLAMSGTRQVALPLEALLEVTEIDEVTPLPQAPAWLVGVTNLRGSVMPVIGLERLVGWEAPTPGQLALVLRDGRFRLAVQVNAVRAVRLLDPPRPTDLVAEGASDGAGITAQSVRVDDRETWIVNVEDLLAKVRRGEPVGMGGR